MDSRQNAVNASNWLFMCYRTYMHGFQKNAAQAIYGRLSTSSPTHPLKHNIRNHSRAAVRLVMAACIHLQTCIHTHQKSLAYSIHFLSSEPEPAPERRGPHTPPALRHRSGNYLEQPAHEPDRDQPRYNYQIQTLVLVCRQKQSLCDHAHTSCKLLAW